MKLNPFILPVLAVISLCSCGGGGGGGTAMPDPTPSNNNDGGGTGGNKPVDIFSFTDRTEEVGLPTTSSFEMTGFMVHEMGGGFAAVDIDEDGDVDLYVMGNGTEPNSLYSNNGDGTFDDVASTFGLDLTHRGSGPTFGDYDGDGDVDLFIGGLNNEANRLLRNDGGVFTDVTAGSGLTISALNTLSAAFSDYDLDGDLDLFLAHWGSVGELDTETLWRNRGDGTFESYSVEAGIAAYILGEEVGAEPNEALTDHTFTPNLSDLDGDGDPELMYASDFGASRMFFNNGDGIFSWGEANEAQLTDEFGMGASVGDYDNDGDMDWFVTSIFGVAKNQQATGNRLYRNDGSGMFEDVSEEAGVRDGHWGWASCFADFDNDGNLDIFHVNGWTIGDFTNDPPLLFHSNGDGTFTEKAISLRLTDRDQGRGTACFDADRDGDLDIALISSGFNKLRFYRNNLGNDNHYIGVRLQGPGHGVGAWIRLETVDGIQVREVKSGNNYVSQDPLEVHFGVATATSADIEISWPDGNTTSLTDVSVDQVLTVAN